MTTKLDAQATLYSGGTGMAEAVWYYAQGENEHGPVTAARIKALADKKELKDSDLVWKEGMPDWQSLAEARMAIAAEAGRAVAPPGPRAARAVAGGRAQQTAPAVGPTPGPAPPGPPAPPGAPPAAPTSGGAPSLLEALKPIFEPLALGKFIGQWMILFGLALVLLAKGCDATATSYADWYNARVEATRLSVEEKFAQEEAELTRDIEDILAIPDADRTNKQSVELSKLRDRRDELQEERAQDLRKLQAERLVGQEFDARSANIAARQWRLWTQRVFTFGTLVLAIGLLAVGFTGSTGQRWICLIMLAVVLFSVYVGGMAWAGSLARLPGSGL